MLRFIAYLALFVAIVYAQQDYGCYSSVSVAVSEGTYTWQTASYCAGLCSDYAYVALKNGNECYCLSAPPSSSDEVSSSDCNVACTGFGTDTCGGSDTYEVFAGEGTEGASASSSVNSSVSKTSSSSTATSSSSSSSSSRSSSTSSSVTSSSAGSSTTSATSESSAATTTTSASSSTTSSTSTSSASASASSTGSSSSKSTTNVGAIAGGVVGGVAAIIIIAFVAFFIIRRRSADDDEDEEEFYDKPNGLGLGRGSTKKSKTSPLDMPIANPFTHPSDQAAPQNTHNGLVDPRLNPVMMGRRRLSEGSLADEADYSRKILHVANPDA